MTPGCRSCGTGARGVRRGATFGSPLPACKPVKDLTFCSREASLSGPKAPPFRVLSYFRIGSNCDLLMNLVREYAAGIAWKQT
jgi:hypothetical protein